MTAYYNEHDPYAAQWLRNLIAADHIAPGDVDERSIEDVRPDELAGYTQCHFFAGVGVWSYALRKAGWPDDRKVWTGSCPCQPFSAAGQGKGIADERHLWPAFHWLIQQRQPGVVFGEQVASKDGLAWLDIVQTDLENTGYTSGAIDLCAAGVGSPNIRQRLWFVAERLGNTSHEGLSPLESKALEGPGRREKRGAIEQPGRPFDGMANPPRQQHNRSRNSGKAGRPEHSDSGPDGGVADTDSPGPQPGRERPEAARHGNPADAESSDGRVADASSATGRKDAGGPPENEETDGREGRNRGKQDSDNGYSGNGEIHGPGPTNGFWRDVDWLGCRDGKWRPAQASPQPLVDGYSESLGRVCPEIIQKIEEEIDAWAMEDKIQPAKVLRDLRESLNQETKRSWPPGRIPGLHEAPFLLAFLRQLSEQGWSIEKYIPLPCEETPERELRMLRDDGSTSGTSPRWELEEQQTGEYSDPVHFLSSLLARFAHQAWNEAHEAYAEIGFPLGHNCFSRVGRLRAYGNAINAEAAAEFIMAYISNKEEKQDQAV